MFGRVAIAGVGLIGGSLGMALRHERLATEVVGIGRSEETLQKALDLGAIDTATTDFPRGVADADLIVLATPISRILGDIERLPGAIPPNAVVTDVGSTKGEIARAGDRAFPDGSFIPGHPMAGSERAGVEAARPDLFHEATWALTPTTLTAPDALQRVRALTQRLGARTLVLDAEAHDRAVAVTSHLPHVLAYALSAIAGEEARVFGHDLYDLAAGSFASGTRVAQSPPEMWRDIALTNRAALGDAVRRCRAELDSVLAALDAADGEALLDAFRRGHEARRHAPA